jgi:hypothetical protein
MGGALCNKALLGCHFILSIDLARLIKPPTAQSISNRGCKADSREAFWLASALLPMAMAASSIYRCIRQMVRIKALRSQKRF